MMDLNTNLYNFNKFEVERHDRFAGFSLFVHNVLFYDETNAETTPGIFPSAISTTIARRDVWKLHL